MENGFREALGRRTWGCWLMGSSVHLQPKSQLYPELHQKRSGQKGEGGDCLLSAMPL